jgi:broad specificity phosphatase PhoE
VTVSLVLVQEADTVWSEGLRVKGRMDLPPLEGALEKLKADKKIFFEYSPKLVYCAPNDPALSSGKIIGSELNIPRIDTDDLVPLEMGSWTGLHWQEVEERYGRMFRRWKSEPETFAPPLGESLSDLQLRLEKLVERIRNNATSAVVVASNDVMCVLCARILPKYGASRSDDEEIHEGSLWRMFDSEKGWMAWDLLLDDEG